MSWQFALCIFIAINVGSIILNKVATDVIPQKSKGVFYQYLFCAVIAFCYALLSGKVLFSLTVLWIGLSGFFLNAFGNYFMWRAFELNLSKSVLFFPLMEIVSIILAVIFLSEASLWNLQLIFGVILCFLAMGLFRSVTNKSVTKEVLNKKWFVFVLLMVLMLGIAGFLVKLFSYTVSRETFVMGFYMGSFLGSVSLLIIEKQNPLQVTKKMILPIVPLCIMVMSALLAFFWVYQLGGSVSLVQPLRGLAITIFPVLIGWFIFKERKELHKREWLGFLCGTAGTILILTR